MENALYFLKPGFWNSPLLVVLFVGSIFLAVFIRYLIASVSFKWISTWFAKISRRKQTITRAAQWKKEIKWATFSSLVFAVLVMLCFAAYQHGYTRIYTDMNDYSWSYFFLSIAAVLILYETYYYWLHRWMHKPSVFKIIHRVHHDSKHTSVFTSFSFHPLEAFLQFIFLPVIIMTMPIHLYAIVVVLVIMTVSALINHAGVELYSCSFLKHPVLIWFIGSTHHELHHHEYRSNFGLYFTFWDKWMKTESRQYEQRFEENTKQRVDIVKHFGNEVS